jgi:hypothetical protein
MQKIETRMPWEPDGSVLAGFAIVNLQEWMLDALKSSQGVHAETLMTVVGTLAGFAAQHAIFETIVKPGRLPLHGGNQPETGAFVIMTTKSGETFYFGDLLNSYLIPQNRGAASLGPGVHSLWGFLSAAVLECGGQPLNMDEIGEIFSHTASAVGGPQFGIPRFPEGHGTAIPPRDALNSAWPIAKAILSREDAPMNSGQTLWPGYWPTVLALVAQKFVIYTKDVLDPALSMRIVYEAAIPMSKVDPRTVPQDPPAGAK